MKVKNVHIQNFKCFTDLTIEGIPETAKMVVLVGPNGCGKTSVFEALNYEYCYHHDLDHDNWFYYDKNSASHPMSVQGVCYSKKKMSKESLFFRSVYRNEIDITYDGIKFAAYPDRCERLDNKTLMDNDSKILLNHQRLMLFLLEDLLYEQDSTKTICELREKYINKISKSISNVFDSLIVCNDHFLSCHSFFSFIKNGEYCEFLHLSSGERAAFDLLLDVIVNQDYYANAILCIDEPEAHIHTKLQGKLIEEIYNLFPDGGQLWITTHSLGVMTKAKELSIQYPGSVVFLDFDGHEFDQPVTLTPSPINQVVCQKFLSVALDGLEEKLAPEIIVLCEGSLEGKESNYNFDAEIYNAIFNEKYPYLTFVSRGCKSELTSDTDKAYLILSLVYQAQSKVYRLVDRDDSSDSEVENLRKRGIFTTSQRNIEGYLLHNDLIKKLAINMGKEEQIGQALEITKTALVNNLTKEKPKPSDDLKSAAQEIIDKLKKLLGLTRCGSKNSAFMKSTMLPLITPETKVYQEMEREIILPILKASGH